jgi:hypothetical protein
MKPIVDLRVDKNFSGLFRKNKGGWKSRFRNFRIFNLPPVGHLNEAIVGILVAVWTTLTTTGFGVTVAGVTVGITWAGAIAVAGVIGLTVYSMTSQTGKGGRGGVPPGVGDISSIDNNGQLVNTRQSSKPLIVIYGVYRSGANVIFDRGSLGR